MYNVYLICSTINNENVYKIGHTKRDVLKRIKELKTGNAGDITLIESFNSKWGTKIESTLHRKYKNNRVRGEWFELNNEEIDSFIDECQLLHNNFELLSKSTLYEEKGKF